MTNKDMMLVRIGEIKEAVARLANCSSVKCVVTEQDYIEKHLDLLYKEIELLIEGCSTILDEEYPDIL